MKPPKTPGLNTFRTANILASAIGALTLDIAATVAHALIGKLAGRLWPQEGETR